MFLNSCKKSEMQNDKNTALNSELQQPTQQTATSQQATSHGSYSQIFTQLSSESLLQIIQSNNEGAANLFLNSLADQISYHYFQSHDFSLYTEFNGDRDKVIMLGIFMAKIETLSSNSNFAAPLDCFLTAVSSIIGLTDARAVWNSIVAGGASVETAVAALKLIAKRVASVITVAIAVYSVIQCLT